MLVILIKQVKAFLLFFYSVFKKIGSKIYEHVMLSYLLLFNKRLDFF